MVNIVVSSRDPDRNSFNISHDGPPLGQQVAAPGQPAVYPMNPLYESNYNIDSYHLREFNVADIWKDAISTNTQVTRFPPLYGAINELFGEQVLPGAVTTTPPRPTWQNVLDEKKNLIKQIMPTNEYEVVFERTKAKTQTELLTLLNFYESGIGVEKILNPIVLAQARTIKNPAQALDAGPSGAGDCVFPKAGDILTFDERFMTSYGFKSTHHPLMPIDPQLPQNGSFNGGWDWSAETLPTQLPGAVQPPPGIKGFEFIINLWLTSDANLHIIHLDTKVPAHLARINQLILGNAVKNNVINNTDIADPDQLERAALLVAFKELGDAMMNAVYISYFYYIQQRYQTAQQVYQNEGYGECPQHIRELSSNQLANLYLTMYTCDATVHYRNVLYGVPSVLTGSKNKVNFGLIYKPTAMPESERLTNLLDIEFNTILNNNIDLKNRWVQSSNSLWILNPSRNNRLKNIGLSPDQVRYGRELINLLNAEVIQLKDAILGTIQQNQMDNAQFLIRINQMKQYLCSPFIVPRFVPGVAGNVQRGCLIDFIIINSVWTDPIKDLAREINNNLILAIGERPGVVQTLAQSKAALPPPPQNGGSGDKGLSDITDNVGNANLLFEGYEYPNKITTLTMNEEVIWHNLLNIFPPNYNDTIGIYDFLSINYMLYCRSVWYLQIMTNANAIRGGNVNKETYIQYAIYWALNKSSYYNLNTGTVDDKSSNELRLTVDNTGFPHPHLYLNSYPHLYLNHRYLESRLLLLPTRQQYTFYNQLLIRYFSFVSNMDNVYKSRQAQNEPIINNLNTRFQPTPYVPLWRLPAPPPLQLWQQIAPAPVAAAAPPPPPPPPPPPGGLQRQKRRSPQQLNRNNKFRTVGPNLRRGRVNHQYLEPHDGGTKRKNVYRKRNNNKYTKKNMKKYTNKSAKYPKIVKKTRKTRKNRK